MRSSFILIEISPLEVVPPPLLEIALVLFYSLSHFPTTYPPLKSNIDSSFPLLLPHLSESFFPSSGQLGQQPPQSTHQTLSKSTMRISKLRGTLHCRSGSWGSFLGTSLDENRPATRLDIVGASLNQPETPCSCRGNGLTLTTQ